MAFSKTIHSDVSKHTLHVSEVDPANLPDLEHKSSYTKFYVVRNWDAEGVTFLYLGKGNENAPDQIVAWYRNTNSFWSGYGTTLKSAIEGAQRDGWLYA